jgi:hypothetical protein
VAQRLQTASPPRTPAGDVSTPSKPQNEIVVSPLSIPTTSPVHPGDELAGFWIFPPAGAPGDYIASSLFFPGRFMQVSRDPAVRVVLGLQQRLRKIIKNLRKIRKMQNQFCWFRGEEIYFF